MATGRRYYWIKLKDSFMTSDTVDFLMSQPGGANYVVLYQMLCLKTINTGGRLSRKIGDVIIPYDIDKIQRDFKWFSADTIRVALELYTRFGLVYRDEDGTLVMTDHEHLVGSETDYAEKNRRMRANQQKCLADGGHNVSSDVSENVSIDNRYKENRDKEIRDKDTTGGTKTADRHDPLVAFAADSLVGLTADLADELVSYRAQMTDDMIRYAINEAVSYGAPSFSYVRKILRRIVEQGFRTLAEIKAAEAERSRARSTPPARNQIDDRPPTNGNPFADVED